MKRSLVTSLIIGLLAAAIVSVLQATGALRPLEFLMTDLVSGGAPPNRMVGLTWHYVAVVLLAIGVSFFTLTTTKRKLVAWLVAALVIELLALPWVFALYKVFFQPIPLVLATVLAFGITFFYRMVAGGTRRRLATIMFEDHLSPARLREVIESDFPLGPESTTHQITAIACDIGNKYELAEDRAPDGIAEMIDRFVRMATAALLEDGAYIQAADGEGVVGVFGFPLEDSNHAETAAKTALKIRNRFVELAQSAPDLFNDSRVQLGLSAGALVAARFENAGQREAVPVGEPLELARRFAIANRAYGSSVIVGPQVFELAEQTLLLRPIDFLSGSATRERFEIYELLKMANEASPEDIARRDAFWTGVVYFREKRWGEAYAEFQKAWGEDSAEDGPLQLYLRRLEPLVLNLTDAPMGETLASH